MHGPTWNIGKFDADHEDWVSHTEHLLQYFIANGIAENAAKRKEACVWSIYVRFS